MFIANYTPDSIEWMHVGQTGTLKPGDITEFDDARGKHILNKWGQRGLLRVSYTDSGSEDEKKAEAMKIYKAFWVKQLSYFNQHNESLKNENKPYTHPSTILETKAKELSIDLISPWKLKETKDASSEEVKSLKNEVSELKDMFKDLLKMTEEITKQRDSALIDQFKDLDRIEFRDFVESNMAKIRTWPESIQALVQAQWQSTQGGEIYPITV